MDTIELHRVKKWINIVVAIVAVSVFSYFGWQTTNYMKNSSTTVVSHPSLMGQPTLNLTFQGSIEWILLPSDNLNEAQVKIKPQPLPFVLSSLRQTDPIHLTLVGRPNELVEVTGQIGKHSNQIDVEFGKTGEAILVIGINSEHQIHFTQKTDH